MNCLDCRKPIPRHSPYKTFCCQSCYDRYIDLETLGEGLAAIQVVKDRNQQLVEKELRAENKSLRIENAELRLVIERLK